MQAPVSCRCAAGGVLETFGFVCPPGGSPTVRMHDVCGPLMASFVSEGISFTNQKPSPQAKFCLRILQFWMLVVRFSRDWSAFKNSVSRVKVMCVLGLPRFNAHREWGGVDFPIRIVSAKPYPQEKESKGKGKEQLHFAGFSTDQCFR